MLNQKALSKLVKGDSVLHFLLLKRCELKTSANGQKQFLLLEVGDQSASFAAFMWRNYEEHLRYLAPGCLVKIAGTVEEYKGQFNINVAKIRAALPQDGVSTEDFLPKSKREISTMESELQARIEKLNTPCLRDLMRIVLSEDAYEKFIRVPAGKSWHHSYLHGLLEHTLEIVRICDLMCDIHPEANRDLLVCGAILHDFGKIEELTFEQGFDYSEKGKLLGHIVIAAMAVSEKSCLVENFPENLKSQLIHLILSHQGKLEFASPVTPKTLESIILYQADELSAKTNAYKSAIMADANGINRWTKYLPLIASSLYIPENFEKEDGEKEELAKEDPETSGLQDLENISNETVLD
ncbi:MAG: HD domain-containing protein [Ignavibacteria bacterium]|jgi:3'-5' exoribonuclease|nr:HD domain-containing protein [Ignavibacteria bacterium]MCU7519638.1 HD domain-containing protein [Ignavibacteria bacterium]HEX2963850.1 HD domain-containing protein [Ignavibacteriales bacterium]